MKRFTIILAVAFALSACNARITPPQISIPSEYSYAEQAITDSLGIDFAWWEYFGDSTLNDLIMRSIANNRNLLVAASRIEQARIELATCGRTICHRLPLVYRPKVATPKLPVSNSNTRSPRR